MLTLGNGAGGAAPEETRADVRAHELLRRGNTALFGVCIVNLDAGSYLRMMPEKALAKDEKEKKDRYLQDLLDGRCHFTPLVFSADRITGKESRAITWKMSSHFSF